MTESYTPAATPATPAEAAVKLDTLSKNSEWASKVLTGSGPHVREFNDLIAKRSGTDRLGQILNGTIEPPILETVMPGELSTRNVMTSVADLREIGLEDATIRQVVEGKPVSKTEWDAVKGIKADRLADKEWRAKYMANDRVAVRDMALMNIVIVGGHT